MSNNYSLVVTSNTLRLSMRNPLSVSIGIFLGIFMLSPAVIIPFALYEHGLNMSGIKLTWVFLMFILSLLCGYAGLRTILRNAWHTETGLVLCIEHQESGKSLLTQSWQFMFGRKIQQTILLPPYRHHPLATIGSERRSVRGSSWTAYFVILHLPDPAGELHALEMSNLSTNARGLPMCREEVEALVRVLNAFAASGSHEIDPADAALVELQTGP